ncbi:MAG: hypothetical protein HXS41_11705 [Theionarchaea archaeon]|nr:hypothetical protein [Theionarchaea archaeon]MBU7000596.1 hypothetical protein [Theionarchaea archaeon]MBU7021714.1 hypothetical protein [Theionarchaea archaeon]
MKWSVCALLAAVIISSCIGQEEFTVTDITFCNAEPFERSYNINPDAFYTARDIVWIYVEAFRFTSLERGEGYISCFDATVEVFDAQGVSQGDVIQSIEIPSDTEPSFVWFKFWIDTIDLNEGIYTVVVTITDAISGERAATEGTFSVVGTS